MRKKRLKSRRTLLLSLGGAWRGKRKERGRDRGGEPGEYGVTLTPENL